MISGMIHSALIFGPCLLGRVDENTYVLAFGILVVRVPVYMLLGCIWDAE